MALEKCLTMAKNNLKDCKNTDRYKYTVHSINPSKTIAVLPCAIEDYTIKLPKED